MEKAFVLENPIKVLLYFRNYEKCVFVSHCSMK